MLQPSISSLAIMQLMKLRCLPSYFIPIIIYFFLLQQNMPSKALTAPTISSDLGTLLAFKSMIFDPSNALSTWDITNTSLHFCHWRGVTCGARHPDRVTRLRLRSLNLTAAYLPPHLANLTFLRSLNLGDNSFSGSIPHELGRLDRLTNLNLSFNYLEGEIPASLTRCSKLQIFDLVANQLSGQIPRDIGSLTQLIVLNLGNNNLIGTIPPSIGNISSSLIYLFLQQNNLTGSIPASMGKLSSLQLLTVGHNELSGNIPSSLYNFSSMYSMVLADNRLTGTLPPDMFNTLPMLQQVLFYSNQLQGPIPISLSNGTNMEELDMLGNNFSGTIPSNLENLQYLYWLSLGKNQLEAKEESDWDFLSSLANCSYLEVLSLEYNNLGSSLPPSLANLSSTLQNLALGWNHFDGSIPDGIGNFLNLSVLSLNDNLLRGIIPASIGKVKQLHVLALMGNSLAGPIPDTIGNLTQLNRLYLQGNGLNSSIPTTIGKLQSLEELNLSKNKLTGVIPKELVMLSSLSNYLDLSHNQLTGPLPPEVGMLANLNLLNISDNNLSGEIPTTFGSCKSLEYLYMQRNFFDGHIPQSLSELKGLQELDLSVNSLSGKIPEYMGSLGGLQYLNMSYNDLEGGVPDEGILRNAEIVSILGNKKLCGGSPALHLSACPTQYPKKPHKSFAVKVILFTILGACLCIILFVVMFAARRWQKNRQLKSPSISLIEGQFRKISYAELLKATDGFSPSNLIGVGGVGSVYKGSLYLDERTSVAIKVLNLQQRGASKSFMSECRVLRSIRHRNLVKIITACSSVDFRGNDFKALVLEFMPNGSLEQWLHPMSPDPSEQMILPLRDRLNIAFDVAFALEYLHHQGETVIVHCDLKPSNILLDADMCARVGDFGLAKFIWEILPNKPDEHETTSTGIKGTIGYVPPEYGMGGQASTYGDVYSYGILLLELFSGRRPTDEMFTDGLSLHNYIEKFFPEQVMDIVDSKLQLFENDQETRDNNRSKNDALMEEYRCLSSLIGIGLSCSKQDPKDRMEMEDIVKEMHTLKDKLHRINPQD